MVEGAAWVGRVWRYELSFVYLSCESQGCRPVPSVTDIIRSNSDLSTNVTGKTFAPIGVESARMLKEKGKKSVFEETSLKLEKGRGCGARFE